MTQLSGDKYRLNSTGQTVDTVRDFGGANAPSWTISGGQQGQNGQPQPLPPGFAPGQAGWDKTKHKFYDLNKGRYAIVVTMGKADATKLEEGIAGLGELIPHLNPAM